MRKNYILKMKDKENKDFFLDFDSTNGGLPFWSSSMNKKRFADEVTMKKYVESIKLAFIKKEGSFYHQNLVLNTLSLCEIGIIKETKI